MALTGSEQRLAPAAAFSALAARAKAWLTDGSDHSLVRRLAGTAFLIRVASAALAFLSQILLARWMGSFQFGIYVTAWTWILLIGGMVDFGIASSAQRFIPEYTERKSFALLRGFLSGSRIIAVGCAATIAALGCLGIELVTPWLSPFMVVPFYLACLTLPLYALAHMQDGIARSYNWVNVALLPQFILRQIALLVFMAAAYAAGFAMDAVTAMVAFILSMLVTGAGQFWVLNSRLAKTIAAGPKEYAVKTWFATSLPIVLVEGFYLLLTYTDIVVLQFFRSPDDVAVYYAATKILSLVAFIYFSVAATIAHKFTTYHVTGNRERLSAFLTQSIRWTFWPSLAATILILALGKPLLWLFGERFQDGYYLLFVLAIGLLARAAVGPVERLLNMLDEQRVCAAVYAFAFGLNLVLCIAFIPRIGMAGAAIATAIALIVESVLLFLVTKHRLGFHVFIFGQSTGR